MNDSPWPFLVSISTFSFFIGTLFLFKIGNVYVFLLSTTILTLNIMMWFRDVELESEEGCHTPHVKEGLKIGMIIFILSEVLFFSAWFWGFFHNSWSPINEIGNVWPPTGITPIDVFSIPLLNTMLLLTSGIAVTWAHNSYLNMNKIIIQMFTTLTLGLLFTFNQLIEYLECSFSISDSIYGATFFITTGFHGLHVIVGSIFLLCVSMIIFKEVNNSLVSHMSFEFSIWYWHFVDVVWLFLFLFMYMMN